ncbi:CdaR family protein [Humidesulfovibrio idahonensis]
MLKNWKDIAIALALAILTWYLLTGREKVEAWVDMNVEMTNAPMDLTIRKGLVSKIEVRVRGPKGLVRSLDRRKWTYSLDVSRLKVGENLVDIDRERIPLSMAYEVVEIKPSRLILTVDRLAKKNVPVVAEWRGALRPDYRLLEIKTQPELVEVRGAERQVRQMTQARVGVQIDFDDPPAVWSDDVPIKLADGVEANPGQVKVTMRFGPEVKTSWVRVPVRVEAGSGLTAHSSIKHVRIQVEAPVPILREAEAGRDIEGLAAVVKLPGGLKAGRHMVRYELEMPEGFRLISRQPETIEVTIRK